MALDTIKLNVGVDGDDLGADNIGGVQYEVVKQAFGVEGDLNLVSAADPLPVTDSAAEVSLASIDAKLTNPLPVSGTVAVSSLPSGLALASLQQTDALTDSELRATPVPVSGTVTVDTSLLATAANQATEIASLSVLDDWDESDRAKVNPIVGQAGVDGNSGNKSDKTLRVVIATDQPNLTTALNVNETARVVATPNKTAANSLVSIQTLASGAVVKSSAINVAGKFGMAVGVHLGRTVTTALTNPVKVRFEFSTEDSLDSNWYPIGDLLSDTIASTTTSTLTTATTAGDTTLPMTATAGILIGDAVLIKDTTLGNSEWGRVITVNANTNVIIEDGTLRNHAITTTQIWSKANIWSFVIDVSRYTRVRCVFDAAYALSGQTVVCEARYTLLDSIT